MISNCGYSCKIYPCLFILSCNELELFPVNIYLFKVNNRSTRKRCEICSKLAIKTPERRQ